MNNDSGFYLMHRGWMENEALGGVREPFCRRAAWAWLIENAAYSPRRVRTRNAAIDLRRGQLSHSLRHLADAWGWDDAKVRRFLARLVECRMIDCVTDAGQTLVTICNYDQYQLPDRVTDAGTDAVPTQHRRSTDANKNEGNEGNEGIQDPSLRSGSRPPAVDEPAVATDLWNELADECGLPKVQSLTKDRRRSLVLRLSECGGLDGWRTALAKVRDSPFLRGQNSRNGWIATLDFVLQPKSFTRLMEGVYDRRQGRLHNDSATADLLGSDRGGIAEVFPEVMEAMGAVPAGARR